MKLDPKLQRRLEELAKERGGDLNAVLAEALGMCPTCGQPLPGAERPKGKPRGVVRSGIKERILEWKRQNPNGTQAACARALETSPVYVNRVWHSAEGETPRGRDDT